MKYHIGIDIGGTKTAVLLIDAEGTVLSRNEFETHVGKNGWQKTVDQIKELSALLISKEKIESIGVSCGGPLDSKKGLILSPPNLPGWDDVPITDILSKAFHIPADR